MDISIQSIIISITYCSSHISAHWTGNKLTIVVHGLSSNNAKKNTPLYLRAETNGIIPKYFLYFVVESANIWFCAFRYVIKDVHEEITFMRQFYDQMEAFGKVCIHNIIIIILISIYLMIFILHLNYFV